MPLSGRPIRCMLVPSTVLLTAVAMGWSAPAFGAGWNNQPLHEKKHDAKRQVEALEEQWRQAQLAGDVAAMDKLLSDGQPITGENMRETIFKIRKFQGLIPLEFKTNTATVPLDINIMHDGRDVTIKKMSTD